MSETAMPAAYPVVFDVEPQITPRNRLTVAFRAILALPHAILVGTPGVGGGGDNGGGVISTVALVMAIISWFAIVLTGKQPKGLWDFTSYYLRWRAKAVAYMSLLRDEYPPFGDGDYPVSFSVGEFPATRDRLSVGLRLLYVLPHVIVLIFVGIAWLVTVIIAWFAILFTGSYPEGLYRFGVGFNRWALRVEAYVLLMQDQYPPFSLD